MRTDHSKSEKKSSSSQAKARRVISSTKEPEGCNPDIEIEVDFDVTGMPLSTRRIKARKVFRRDPFLAMAPDPEDFISND